MFSELKAGSSIRYQSTWNRDRPRTSRMIQTCGRAEGKAGKSGMPLKYQISEWNLSSSDFYSEPGLDGMSSREGV